MFSIGKIMVTLSPSCKVSLMALNPFLGRIDEAATYSVGLSSTQAGNRYNMNRRLVSLYHLDNANTASSGNAFTLTNTGVTYASTTPVGTGFNDYAPFDGTATVHLDYTTATSKLAATNVLTLEAWVIPMLFLERMITSFILMGPRKMRRS